MTGITVWPPHPKSTKEVPGQVKFDCEAMAANLRRLRAEKSEREGREFNKGISQAEVAQAVGLDVNTVSNYELGRSVPTFSNMWKLADYYGVSLDEIGGRTAPGAL